MKRNKSKGLEPPVVKAIIVTMSLLYILSPLHMEISKLVHSISHAIEMPDTVLSHQNKTAFIKTHNSFEHESVNVNHDHEILDFLETILEETNTKSEFPNTLSKPKNVDKHIRVIEEFGEEKQLAFSKRTTRYFREKENKCCKGFSLCFGEPPKTKVKLEQRCHHQKR